MSTTARVLEFDVSVDRERTARSERGGSAISPEESWSSEHLVLAGLVRCTLASLDYSAERAGLEVEASGTAHGVVTRREEDGRYAFVTIDSSFDVALDPSTDRQAVRDLVEMAEKGCFIGNSLTARPRYRWTVNGEELP